MASPEPQISGETSGYSTTPALVPTYSSNHSGRRSPDPDRARTDQDIIPSRNDDDEHEHGAQPLRRNSAFLEVGLGGNDAIVDAKLKDGPRPRLQVRFRSKVDVVEPDPADCVDSFPANRRATEQMPFFVPTLPRLLFLALVIVLIIPSLHTTPLFKVDANPVGTRPGPLENVQVPRSKRELPAPNNVKREDSPTDVCKRWAGQSAVVNGTLYYYGGRSTTSTDQTTNEWSMLFPTHTLNIEYGLH